MTYQDTLGVLQQLERGEINADQAQARLDEPQSPTVEVNPAPFEEPAMAKWIRRLWVWPLTVGILTVMLGTWIISSTFKVNVLWFFCGLPFVLLGALVIALAASAQSSHWIYINVENKKKRRERNVHLGFPLPFGLVRFAILIARPFMKYPTSNIKVGTRDSRVQISWDDTEQIIQTLEQELKTGHGMTIDVDDNDETVQVYIV